MAESGAYLRWNGGTTGACGASERHGANPEWTSGSADLDRASPSANPVGRTQGGAGRAETDGRRAGMRFRSCCWRLRSTRPSRRRRRLLVGLPEGQLREMRRRLLGHRRRADRQRASCSRPLDGAGAQDRLSWRQGRRRQHHHEHVKAYEDDHRRDGSGGRIERPPACRQRRRPARRRQPRDGDDQGRQLGAIWTRASSARRCFRARHGPHSSSCSRVSR